VPRRQKFVRGKLYQLRRAWIEAYMPKSWQDMKMSMPIYLFLKKKVKKYKDDDGKTTYRENRYLFLDPDGKLFKLCTSEADAGLLRHRYRRVQ